MTPAKNTAPVEPTEVHVDIIPTVPANLRLVEDGETAEETGELTAEELVEHFTALALAAQAAAVELAAEAKRFIADADAAKAELLKLLPTGKYPVGNVTVTVSEPSRSFDQAAFEAAFPVEKNPALYKPVVNTAAVPPNLKDQFMVAGKGERKVAIK